MGRHSAPDDDEAVDPAVDSPAVVTASGSEQVTTRPGPGRHATALEVIEHVMDDDEAPAGPPAEDTSLTARIRPIADPVLDEPVPSAVTDRFTPVRDEPVAPSGDPHDADRPGDASADRAAEKQRRADQKAAAKAAKAEQKLAAKAEKARQKLAAKAGKAEQKLAAKAEKAEQKPAAETGRAEHEPVDVARSTADAKATDLALLRTDAAARARVIAAVVVPFLIYVGVLLVIGRFELRTALIWIWLPMITAGVVAGLMLDLGHRAAAARASAAPPDHPAP